MKDKQPETKIIRPTNTELLGEIGKYIEVKVLRTNNKIYNVDHPNWNKKDKKVQIDNPKQEKFNKYFSKLWTKEEPKE